MIGRSAAMRVLAIMVRIAVTGGAAFLVLRNIGLMRIAGIALHIGATWYAAAFTLAFLHVVFSAKRWQYLYAMIAGSPPPLWRMIHLTGKSLLFGALLPSSLGADAIRAGAMAASGGLQPAARSVICDRLIGLFALLLVVSVTAPFIVIQSGAEGAVASVVVVSLSGVAAFGLLIFAPRWLAHIPAVGSSLATARSDIQMALMLRHDGPRVAMLSLALHVMAVAVFALLVRSAGAENALFASVMVAPSALLVSALPISIGGWGLREAAMMSGFAIAGADPLRAATASILYGFIWPLCGAIIDMLAMFSRTKLPNQTSDTLPGPIHSRSLEES